VSYSAAKVLKFHTRGVQRVRLDIVPARNAPVVMAMLQRPKMVP